MAGEKLLIVVLTVWLVAAPLALLSVAVIHERRAARRRYEPPRPGPGDDWGGTHVHRLGWWRDGTAGGEPRVDAG